MTSVPAMTNSGAARSATRILSGLVLVLIALALSSASAPRGPLKQTGKLLLLSTSDVKGKTGPCG